MGVSGRGLPGAGGREAPSGGGGGEAPGQGRQDAVRALKAGRRARARGPSRAVSARLTAPTESLSRKLRPASAPPEAAPRGGRGAAPTMMEAELAGAGAEAAETSPRGESLDNFEGVETARIRAEEDALRKRAAQLQSELRDLAESRVRLSMRSEEQRLRLAAREQLARFEETAGGELGKRVAGLLEERGEKVAECGRFRRMVLGKIDALKQILVQLQRRQGKLEEAYDAAVRELREEHAEALREQKELLESGVRQHLAQHLKRLQQSQAAAGPGAAAPLAGGPRAREEGA